MDNTITTPEILNLDFRFERLLGEGANGRTWLAIERKTSNEVAIKELKLSSDLKSIELFEREAEVLQAVNVQGVPKFYKCVLQDENSDTSYIIQEFIPYPSLQSMLDDGMLFSEEEVLDIMTKVTHILIALQTQYLPPIVHRDIKPANILYDAKKKNLWLIDFGAVANPQKQSGGSTIAGTYGYMAPEQLQGESALQSDFYSLGATALHLLTGVSPFDIDVSLFKLEYEPVLEATAPQTSPRLRQILASLLSPNVSDRPQTAAKLLKLIQTGAVSEEKTRGPVYRFLASIAHRVSSRIIKWKPCVATIRGANNILASDSLHRAAEATYEYNQVMYQAFVLLNEQEVIFFSVKDMPSESSKEVMDQVKIECFPAKPGRYRLPSQFIWLSDGMFDAIQLPENRSLKLNKLVEALREAFKELTQFTESYYYKHYVSHTDGLTISDCLAKIQYKIPLFDKAAKLYMAANEDKLEILDVSLYSPISSVKRCLNVAYRIISRCVNLHVNTTEQPHEFDFVIDCLNISVHLMQIANDRIKEKLGKNISENDESPEA